MTTKTKAKVGAQTAKAMVEHPALRKATAAVAPPVAKTGFRIGRRRARKRALVQAERLGDFARTAGDAITTYGPPAAEALGLVEPPKKSRTPQTLAAGAVLGGTVALLLEPKGGAARRARVARLLVARGRPQQA